MKFTVETKCRRRGSNPHCRFGTYFCGNEAFPLANLILLGITGYFKTLTTAYGLNQRFSTLLSRSGQIWTQLLNLFLIGIYSWNKNYP